jgi:hypothetical protein
MPPPVSGKVIVTNEMLSRERRSKTLFLDAVEDFSFGFGDAPDQSAPEPVSISALEEEDNILLAEEGGADKPQKQDEEGAQHEEAVEEDEAPDMIQQLKVKPCTHADVQKAFMDCLNAAQFFYISAKKGDPGSTPLDVIAGPLEAARKENSRAFFRALKQEERRQQQRFVASMTRHSAVVAPATSNPPSTKGKSVQEEKVLHPPKVSKESQKR